MCQVIVGTFSVSFMSSYFYRIESDLLFSRYLNSSLAGLLSVSLCHPNAMKRWHNNWDVIAPIFKFSAEVRKVIYTTNAIESLNFTYRKLNRQRSVFPSSTALLKALYLASFEVTKKWTMPVRNCGQIYGELSVMYEGGLPE